MFDNVIVDYPLPLPLEVIDIMPDVYAENFQTKDLDNLLTDFIIDESGNLLELQVKREWVDDDSAFLKGYFKAIDEKIVPFKYHGIIRFYTYETIKTSDISGYDVSLDYQAKFNDGVLVDLELIDYEIRDAAEHLKNTKEFFRKLDIKRNKWYNKYILNTKPVTFIRRKIIQKFFYKLHSFTGTLYNFTIKYL